MTLLKLSILINAPKNIVWKYLEDVPSHTTWMQDAESIVFVSEETSVQPPKIDIGTTFLCTTKVGPFRTQDIMVIKKWEPLHIFQVRHEGAVTGTGTFTLHTEGSSTLFVWSEELNFPWWMGASIGSTCAKPILKRIWEKNLLRLKSLIESDIPSP